MWTEGNYRRIFLDMHINETNDEYLSKLNPERIVELLKECNAQQIVVKCRPHTGLANFPTKYGKMNDCLNGRDYVGEMVNLCRENSIATMAYFSQIFDNYAYEYHPAWRVVNAEGKTSMEYNNYNNDNFFRNGRYGIVCPNNEEYRQYVVDCVTEIVGSYKFDSIFMDMPFWPDVCYCYSCRKKYFEATGKELPRVFDGESKEFRDYLLMRDEWMGEFAKIGTEAIKRADPDITVEQNQSGLVKGWSRATSDYINDVCDYTGGDYFGGYIEQTFINKFYRNLSKTLPYNYITSRCDPNLTYHTSSKTTEELMLDMMTTLIHNGAFSIVDGINPDGTICEEVYRNSIKKVFNESEKYEPFISGDLIKDVSIFFDTHNKFDDSENGKEIAELEKEKLDHTDYFVINPLSLASILKENHILYDVISYKQLENLEDKVLAISNMSYISDDNMKNIENYIANGGALYVSGKPGHPRLLEMLGATYEGDTDSYSTYISPLSTGEKLFKPFDNSTPLSVLGEQTLLSFTGNYEVLGTLTLPYTDYKKRDFSAIHSNPPGINTDKPSVVRKKYGKGTILWVAAPIENSKSFYSKQIVARLFRDLIGTTNIEAHAPADTELVLWEKEDKKYMALINQQSKLPVYSYKDITITLNNSKIIKASLPVKNIELEVKNENTIYLPKLHLYEVIEIVEETDQIKK